MTQIKYLSCKVIFITTSILIILMVFPRASSTALAEQHGPDRKATITSKVTEYTWWLVQWSDNEVICEVNVGHEDLPKLWEVYNTCGEDIFDEWQDSDGCEQAGSGGDTSICTGFYLHFVGSQEVEREIEIDLPPPVVWVSVRGCEEGVYTNYCTGTPRLEFKAEEPLPYEEITAIYAQSNAGSVVCSSDYCLLTLGSDYQEGVEIEFWADSSYGDESLHYTAIVRAELLERNSETGDDLWQVDVISDRWQGIALLSCAFTWEVFPPIEQLPAWLTTPDNVEGLATNVPYEMLAGRLLRWGIVEAPECPFGGLMANGSANNCAVIATRDFVYEWQDRFDENIFNIANEVDIPAMLMKGIFAQESQFWPGTISEIKEYGLGQLHEQGGDVLLLWNPSFYKDFCPLILAEETCEKRYEDLDEETQELLRGALTVEVNVACPTCEGGVDLDRAELSVDLFGHIVRANCDQVGQTVRFISGDRPGAVSSYEDLWRFVLVNYNAGSGCLATSLDATSDYDEPFNWEHVSGQLLDLEACDGAVEYVEKVTRE
jgi:hypothetical protein